MKEKCLLLVLFLCCSCGLDETSFVAIQAGSDTAGEQEALALLQAQADALPPGGTFVLDRSYEIGGTIVFADKQAFTFDGRGHSITQLDAKTPTIHIVRSSDTTVKNLTLIGDPGSYDGTRNGAKGIYMENGTGSHLVENVVFVDHGYAGFESKNTANVVFDSCTFRADGVDLKRLDNYNSGIYAYGAGNEDWEVKNSTFDNIGMGIIMQSFNNGAEIHHNTFTNVVGQHGVYLGASSDIDVYENDFADIELIAIKLQVNIHIENGPTNVRIHNNRAINRRVKGNAGVSVTKVSGAVDNDVRWRDVHVWGNYVDNFQYGLNLNSICGSQVHNNILRDSVYGLFAKDHGGQLRNNEIQDTELSGMYVGPGCPNESLVVEGNEIRNAVHVTSGMSYQRSVAFIVGAGQVVFVQNRMTRGDNTPKYGLYQSAGIHFEAFHDNVLLDPLRLDGTAEPSEVFNNETLP